MVDLEIAQRWTPKSDIGLESLWVIPARTDADGNVLAYRCQKCESGGSITMAREVLEAYYERDGDEPQEAAT